MADQKSSPDQGHHRPEWWTRHLWQIQPVRDGLLIAAIFGVIYLGWLVSIVTVPLLLALLLAYLFEPLVKLLTRTSWISREMAAIAIILATVAIVVVPATLGLGFAAAQGTTWATEVVADVQRLKRSLDDPKDETKRGALPRSWRTVRDYVAEIEGMRRERDAEAAVEPPEGGAAPEATPTADAPKPTAIQSLVVWAVGTLRANADGIAQWLRRSAVGSGTDAALVALRALASVGAIVFTLFLTAFFFFFVSTGWGRVLAFWEGLIPERKRGRFVDLVKKMDKVIAAFVRGRLVICTVLMVYYTVGYWLIGVSAPLVLGPIVGALALLPYMSGLIGVPTAALLLWLDPPGAGFRAEWWWIIAGPLLVSMGAQLLDDYFLNPLIQGKGTGMDIPTIVFASIAGGALAGVYGLILAIPVAACVKILLKEVFWPRFRAWAEGRSPDPLPIGPTAGFDPPTRASGQR